jgi:hypothetical protein
MPSPSPPSLQEATRNSTAAWQRDLGALFVHAKDRFPDVVWDFVGEDDLDNSKCDQVWGHKGGFSSSSLPRRKAYISILTQRSSTLELLLLFRLVIFHSGQLPFLRLYLIIHPMTQSTGNPLFLSLPSTVIIQTKSLSLLPLVLPLLTAHRLLLHLQVRAAYFV